MAFREIRINNGIAGGLIFLFALGHITLYSAKAQESDAVITTVNATIYSPHFDRAKTTVSQFMSANSCIVIKQNESIQDFFIECYLTQSAFNQLDSLFNQLGFVDSKQLASNSSQTDNEKILLQLKYLNERKKVYQTELSSMTEKDERYYKFWEESREIEKEIYALETSQLDDEVAENYYLILNIYDDAGNVGDTNIDWVNMPGASFDLMVTENPSDEYSCPYYQGYMLKYMVTRGKTYANLGFMKGKGLESTPDTSMFTELFLFGFGQDWYTKHFGRGRNRFFNLYTGYNFGGMFATAESRTKTMFQMKVFLGVELFKNKYFLIDNNIGYFIPFVYNRDLRGLSYSFSINFVF